MASPIIRLIRSPTASFPLLEALRKSTHLGAQPVYPFHHVHLSFTLHPVIDALPGSYTTDWDRSHFCHHTCDGTEPIQCTTPLAITCYVCSLNIPTHSLYACTDPQYCSKYHILCSHYEVPLYRCADCSWTVSALLHGRSPCITTHRDQPSLCYTVLALVT